MQGEDYEVPAELRAYAAGLFDGEGCIYIAARRHGRYVLRVTVSMTNRANVEWLATVFGGKAVWRHPPSHVASGNLPQWRWELNSARAGRFLAMTRPWLQTKARAADIGLELQSRMSVGGNGRGGLPPGELAAREALRMRLRLVNGARLCDVAQRPT
jgi:hypothetical protein